MDGAELGKTYWMESVRASLLRVLPLIDPVGQKHYFKAIAYRVEPHSTNSFLSVDGEEYPFEPFEVEVHKGLARLLSPYGVYNVKFSVPDPRKTA